MRAGKTPPHDCSRPIEMIGSCCVSLPNVVGDPEHHALRHRRLVRQGGSIPRIVVARALEPTDGYTHEAFSVWANSYQWGPCYPGMSAYWWQARLRLPSQRLHAAASDQPVSFRSCVRTDASEDQNGWLDFLTRIAQQSFGGWLLIGVPAQ